MKRTLLVGSRGEENILQLQVRVRQTESVEEPQALQNLRLFDSDSLRPRESDG